MGEELNKPTHKWPEPGWYEIEGSLREIRTDGNVYYKDGYQTGSSVEIYKDALVPINPPPTIASLTARVAELEGIISGTNKILVTIPKKLDDAMERFAVTMQDSDRVILLAKVEIDALTSQLAAARENAADVVEVLQSVLERYVLTEAVRGAIQGSINALTTKGGGER